VWLDGEKGDGSYMLDSFSSGLGDYQIFMSQFGESWEYLRVGP